MSTIKLQSLKGFRDFLPMEKRQRDWLTKRLVSVFERFGFEPLQTPTLEYADLILGKYGAEADKLVYQFKDRGGRRVAMPYDQTVPTTRILTQYRQQLALPFRRYQIQNVFRADNPQKGRWREFTQCDADIFGSNSTLADAEILACAYAVLESLGFKQIILKINDRQILFDRLTKYQTSQLNVLSIIQSIDKLEKLGRSTVTKELIKKGLNNDQISKLLTDIQSAPASQTINQITTNAVTLGVPQSMLQFSPTLARGLDYYTGMIVEVVLPQYQAGSVAGGGRYDNLIEQISGVQIPAVGIAFGFDRLLEAAMQQSLIPADLTTTKVLVTIFDQTTLAASLKLANKLRQAGINTEVFPEVEKLDKQLKYADRKSIPFVIIQGPEEQKKGTLQLKNMTKKTQQELTVEQTVNFLSKS